MHWIRNIFIKIKGKSIVYSIVFIIILLLINSAFIYNTVSSIKQDQENREDMVAIKSGLERILDNIQNADLGLRGYFIIQDDRLSAPLRIAREQHEEFFNRMRVLFDKYELEDTKLISFEKQVDEYIAMGEDLITKIDAGDFEAVKAVVDSDPGYDLWQEYVAFSTPVNELVDKKAAQAQANYESIIFNTIVTQLLLLGIGLPTMLLMIRRVNKNDNFLSQLFGNIEESNRQYVFNNNEEIDTQDEKEIINSLTNNLKEATRFINSVSQGNYDTEWTGMNEELLDYNEENLAGELINMRDRMKQVKNDDEVRMWFTEGIAKFSEIVRRDFENLTAMSDEIISNSVAYLKANQGGLFLVDKDEDEQTYIELMGTYAYDRKRYNEKKILPGQGLIGQTYKEGETLHLTEVPNNYVEITSGLGEATASNLIIVPLIVNETIVGLMELASFNPFQPHEIEFLEKMGEIIASSINSIKTNEQTKKILEKSQQQGEEMLAQEEEMRQNMEELEATHEEMRRNEQRMNSLLEEAKMKEKSFTELEKAYKDEIRLLNNKLSSANKPSTISDQKEDAGQENQTSTKANPDPKVNK